MDLKEPSNSMRIDIPKDNVLPAGQRDEGVKYRRYRFPRPRPADEAHQ
jgi:hypothetical protein